MYLIKTKRPKGKHQISISKAIRDPLTKKSKRIQVKSFGTYDLNSKEGKKALALAEKELKEMNDLEQASKAFDSFEDFILSTRKKGISLNHKNIGFIPYLKIFNELKLPNFFKTFTNESKIDYNFSDMMFYQALGRLFNPASKRARRYLTSSISPIYCAPSNVSISAAFSPRLSHSRRI